MAAEAVGVGVLGLRGVVAQAGRAAVLGWAVLAGAGVVLAVGAVAPARAEGSGPVAGQNLTALARLDPERSFIADTYGGVEAQLSLSQPVPWRVRLLDNPPRAILDFREVDFQTAPNMHHDEGGRILGLKAGVYRPGWSRLVIELNGPYRVDLAGMDTAPDTRVTLRLVPTDVAQFAALVAQPDPPEWALPPPADLPTAPPPRLGQGPLVVVLDPGHGGIDPGAEAGGTSEAAQMLRLAREVKEVLLRDGGFRVVLTRDDDVFVPLEARTSIARQAGAQVFLSLHADALPEGEVASGATIYHLAEDASDAASKALAERHDRDDLLAGVDLRAQDDMVAAVLMDMARAETTPRTNRLAEDLRAALVAGGIKMYQNPIQGAAFSVLKSPDIPSLLLETAFLTVPGDRARLTDAAWRGKLALAIRDGLKNWARAEAALQAQAGN